MLLLCARPPWVPGREYRPQQVCESRDQGNLFSFYDRYPSAASIGWGVSTSATWGRGLIMMKHCVDPNNGTRILVEPVPCYSPRLEGCQMGREGRSSRFPLAKHLESVPQTELCSSEELP
jgi:hypothetical protein